MAVLEDDDVEGVDYNRARVGDRIRASDIARAAKDQAALFRQITGDDVPGAPGSTQATPHIHDGTSGVIIPIPLAHYHPRAQLDRAAGVVTGEDWARLIYAPFFAPEGVTSVRVLVRTRLPAETMPTIRVSTESTPGTVQSLNTFDLLPGTEPGSGYMPGAAFFTLYADVGVAEGAFNLINLEAWDGYYLPGATADGNDRLPPARDVYQITILPVTSTAALSEWGPWTVSPVEETGAICPDDRYPREPSPASPYTSLDEAMVGEDRSLNAYLTTTAQMNNALMWEVLTGRPSSGLALDDGDREASSKRYIGHPHAGSTSDLDFCGAQIDHALMSHAYGIGRQYQGASANIDTVHSGASTWRGKIHAPRPPDGAGATWTTMARHRYRMPRCPSGDLTGAATKLKACALAYNYTTNDATVRFRVYDEDGNSAGGAETSSTISSGISTWHKVEVGNVSQSVGTSGERRILQVEVEHDDSDTANPLLLYGVALAYEGA